MTCSVTIRPDLPLFAELSDALLAWEVPDASLSLSAHSFPLVLPSPDEPPPNLSVRPGPASSTDGRSAELLVFSTALTSARLLDAAELLRRGLLIVPGPRELSDIGGDLDEYFLFTDDCDVVLCPEDLLLVPIWPGATCGWKTGTLARDAISSQPICQCIASTARQGSPISFAIMSHMSFLNL